MQDREKLITKVMDAGGRLRVRSALNPVLWLCGIVSAPSMISLSFSTTQPLWLIVIASAPIFVALAAFIFLLLFDRDKLQSEEYQIRKRSLELIEEKGNPQAIDAVSAVVITNPEAPQIGNDAGGDENA